VRCKLILNTRWGGFDAFWRKGSIFRLWAATATIAGMNARQTTIWKLFLKFLLAVVLLWLASPEGCPLRTIRS